MIVTMAQSSRVLIKGATILTINPSTDVQENTDILITDECITSIGRNLSASGDVEIIDGTGCIITPGFVGTWKCPPYHSSPHLMHHPQDCHHHLWQQLLRGMATDWSLFDYFVGMRTKYGSLYSPEDVYFANYSAGLNLLNNGVTTVLDHCHIMNSPAHSDAAVKGLQDAGIRGTFCYGFYENRKDAEGSFVAENWDQKAREQDALRIRKQLFPDNDPQKTLLTFGIAPNEAQAVPMTQVIEEVKLSREIGARVITNHISMGNGDISHKAIIQSLADANLLGPDMVFSHCSALTDNELAEMKKSGAAVCATPDTEMQMGMGHPVGFRAVDAGCKASLGLDITSLIGNDFIHQMRLMLQAQRFQENGNKRPLDLARKTHEVLRLATLGGAEAMQLDHLTGSVMVGKKADLIMFRVDDINTVPLVDPIGGVVFHTSPQNIDTVIVNGKIVKKCGQLVGLDWPKLRGELTRRSARIVEAADKIDSAPQRAQWRFLFEGMQEME